MAKAIAEGVSNAGAEVDIKRVPETVPEAIARSAHFKLDQKAPVAEVAELADYDAIIVGTGTRFGRMSSQMAAFLDQAGGLWARGALNGKVGAAFASTATQHGGQETTLFSIITNLLHFGMTIVGLPYSQDRKSTRLNSSHLGISYAVFCLKKKTPVINGQSPAVDRGFGAAWAAARRQLDDCESLQRPPQLFSKLAELAHSVSPAKLKPDNV